MPRSSPPPERTLPAKGWAHFDLYQSVREALRSLPVYFETETFIEGVSATDIFTLNSAFGATIEAQVVDALNRMRPIWDPDEKYLLYRFVRQSQTFPDVLLRKTPDQVEAADDSTASGGDGILNGILMGIELKGWYLLAKEGEPSFRYKITPEACARQDLIAVVPWALQNVISGSPRVFAPYVESARYAAKYRNYYWQVLRDTSTDTSTDTAIHAPSGVSPYPDKTDHIIDRPASDSGSNFGRFARTRIMDDYLERAKALELCGISAGHWLSFFSIFREQQDEAAISEEIEKLSAKLASSIEDEATPKAESLRQIISGLHGLLNE